MHGRRGTGASPRTPLACTGAMVSAVLLLGGAARTGRPWSSDEHVPTAFLPAGRPAGSPLTPSRRPPRPHLTTRRAMERSDSYPRDPDTDAAEPPRGGEFDVEAARTRLERIARMDAPVPKGVAWRRTGEEDAELLGFGHLFAALGGLGLLGTASALLGVAACSGLQGYL
mmetsp:Transcript_21727/g.68312  ORF Transcript_21727/g.68312 Transcript_21727/m.68312 type:complete len:170 (+) Transcript_21727:66-575(+)